MFTNVRVIEVYDGDTISIASQGIRPNHAIDLKADQETLIQNGQQDGYFLLLQE